MVKQYLILLGFLLFIFVPLEVVKADSVSNEEDYVTTQDIVSDIVFPSIDKRVMKEYGGNAATFGWQWERTCDSPKIGCKHDFKIKILDYKHLSQ